MLEADLSSSGVQGPGSQKILSPLVILSMEKTMVTKVIRELKIFRETGPSFGKNLKSTNRLEFTNHLGKHCLFHR